MSDLKNIATRDTFKIYVFRVVFTVYTVYVYKGKAVLYYTYKYVFSTRWSVIAMLIGKISAIDSSLPQIELKIVIGDNWKKAKSLFLLMLTGRVLSYGRQ